MIREKISEIDFDAPKIIMLILKWPEVAFYIQLI